MLKLSLRDRDRIHVLRDLEEGTVSVSKAARRMGLSPRHVRRLRRRFREEGDAGVIHRGRGRRPNNRTDDRIRTRALERASESVFHDFGPTLLAEHLSRDPDIGPLKGPTLRTWLIEEGRWKVKKRGKRHRKARPRRAALGELIQLDGSDHAWFEDRYPGRLTLLKAIDDATNRIQLARFVPSETGAAFRQFLLDYLARYGRPLAFYTDKAACFGQITRPYTPDVPLEEREAKATESIIRSALKALNVELILANSPQAKGRVERDFGTSQDRLIKEMRIEGITSMKEGNGFLEAAYVPFWNERFAVEAADHSDLHRPLPEDVNLKQLFSRTEKRSVANDFTIRYKNVRYQIAEEEADGIRPKDRIILEHRLDGVLRFRHGDRYLNLTAVEQCERFGPKHEPRPKGITPPRKSRAKPGPKYVPVPPKPKPDHPWKRNPIRVGKALRGTSAASHPTSSSPRDPG
jgi:transposase